MARKSGNSFGSALAISLACTGMLFVVKAFELAEHISLGGFGIVPRTKAGLIGILFSPLLHGNIAHLIANALPLLVLLTLLFWDNRYRPMLTLTLIWLASGLGTWLIGRDTIAGEPTVHIGASSIIYGLIAYLIASGFWMQSWRAAFIALGVFILYGGAVYGMLPQQGHISWEGHFCGALAGIWAASWNHR